MAPAPQYGMMTFMRRNGETFSLDIYHSDVANAQANFDSGSGAGTASLTYWKVLADCVLIDYALTTGMTDTKAIVLTVDGATLPAMRLRFVPFVNTSNARPKLAVPLRAGTNLGAIQVA